jgi:8-amino-7-oxononanoate synthase
MIVEAVRANLRVIEAQSWRREHLGRLIEQLRVGLAGLRWQLSPSSTAIQPIIVGANQAVLEAAAALRAQGLWVPAIRPPTVPPGLARLRISLSAAHTQADVAQLVKALQAVAAT